ncbi:MAG: 2-oxoacid:acceptor oxidoreductase subunit alpha [Candidatus Komeilibacteria bacterium]|jgi:2-oxoglutarate/2-oxoacid ferredoxin oxidoreductase subunit alpha|nr:2-oxoacid:acceptor oxidoreductase subunit alpha [Candidatus Komeilibacteria bacterium]MBT4447371.1 2-oxoacid:acceptor oxidoreductase subunit alpha [Candidatus Komeilibacteria bacterium]
MQNKNNLTWKIAGEAGFGIKSAGMMFGKIFMRAGYEIFDFTEYPSLIRGGHNTYQLVVDTRPVNSVFKKNDILVALNQNTIKQNLAELNSGGALIYDSDKVKVSPAKLKNDHVQNIGIPLTSIAKEAGGELMRNVVALGATMYLVGQKLTIANKVVKETFSKKGKKIVDNNLKALKAGYDFVKENSKDEFMCQLPTLAAKDNIFITANESMALGAVAGGLGFYAAYPMTPSSSILHYLAKIASKTGLVVKHAEDEISVANMALGASHMGARSMVATSGGGFALMTETLGLMGLTETPMVLINVQRGGPATGLPTWTEQADLQFMLHAAQGDFPRIVMAPGDAGEAFEMGHQALNWADMYQAPVLILSDKLIGEGNTTVPRFNTKNVKINRGKILTQAQLSKIKEYGRYKVTPDGISPRALPGMKGGLFIANSDEHDAYGFSNEDSQNRIDQVDKRYRKLDQFRKIMPKPLIYGNPKAKKTVVFWGSNKGVVLDSYVALPDKIKSKIRIMQYQYLWPFDADFTKKILDSSKDILLIENNPNGQLANLIAQETGIMIENKLLKYDGRPFFREEIISALKKL